MTLSLLHKFFYFGIIAGLAGIVVALFCLLAELKHYTVTSRYNTHITFLGKFLDFNIALGQQRELADVYQRGLKGLKGLGREEQSQFFSIATRNLSQNSPRVALLRPMFAGKARGAVL